MRFLERFVALGDDDQIHLTTIGDEVCGSCIFGTHCGEDQQDEAAIFSFIAIIDDIARRAGRRSTDDYQLLTTAQHKIARLITTKRVLTQVIASQKATRPFHAPSRNV